jgi:hypothetical protein
VKQHYVWLIWSSAFLIPWTALYLIMPALRGVMWRASLATTFFGLTEPIFVPAYWNPPSLFELAQRTGFDIESLIFSFALGGIGTVLYDAFAGRNLAPVSTEIRQASQHRLHRGALLLPFAAFVPLYLLSWNPIYAVLACLVLGAVASNLCRPELRRNSILGGVLFLGLYAMFMLGLKWLAPGYIAAVWNLSALKGGLVYGIPTEELLFGFAFGLYWSGVYEHFTWSVDGGAIKGSPRKLPRWRL